MIDREKLKENFEYFDNEMILEIIDIFISEYPDRISKLKSDIAGKDLIALKFDAHSIKGVVANFQRDGIVVSLAAKLEEIAGTAINKETRTLLDLSPDVMNKIHSEAVKIFPEFLNSIEKFNTDLAEIRKDYE